MLHLYRDLKRVLVLTENLLYLAGRSLQRRAVRNGLLVSIAMSSTIIKTNYVNAQTLTPEQLTALILGAFASYPAGALLVRLANFMTRDNLEAAAGGYLHLTSHYKQSRVREHLHYLWHEVFRYETLDGEAGSGDAGTASRPADGPGHMLFQDHLLVHDDERTGHDGFIAAATRALASPAPMGLQSARAGVHLGPVEDWYEKGFFAYEDFPAKAFSRDPLIKRMRRFARPGMQNSLQRVLGSEMGPSFWYAFTVRKFGTGLGKAIIALNRESEAAGLPDYFDAQHFIWPSAELDVEVSSRFADSRPELAARFTERRRQLFRKVFSDDPETARRHVMRMFHRDYAWVFRLRLEFDGEFAAGRLHAKPTTEVVDIERWFSIKLVPEKIVDRYGRHAGKTLDLLDSLLGPHRHRPGLTSRYRAMQIAACIDYRGFRTRLVERSDRRGLRGLLLGDDATTRDIGLLLELLRRVRLYHALTRIQILDYWSIVESMAELPRG